MNISIFEGNASNVSTASAPIPVTDGTASVFLFIPFTDFTGPVNPNNVDAIQFVTQRRQHRRVGRWSGRCDWCCGPKTVNIANDPGSDLVITKSNSTTTVVAGQSISYTVVVQNQGPLNVSGAVVADVIPATILNPTFTSTTTGTVTATRPAARATSTIRSTSPWAAP